MARTWKDVLMGQQVIGYVFKKHGKWVAMMEPEGKTATRVGEASSDTEAMNMVIASYLRT